MLTCEEKLEALQEKIKLYRFDFLTGLKQRRDFDHDLREKFSKKSFWLCYYDVNHLHKVNREKGFATGDQLIRQVANDIQYQDIPHSTYRTSGDEFYTICCEEPTKDVDNATLVYINTKTFDTIEQIMAQLDAMMISEKRRLKNRREDDG